MKWCCGRGADPVLYAIAFLVFAAALAYLALSHGGVALLLLWPAMSFLVVSLGYAVLGPRVMGKGADGRVAWWSRVLLLPFRLFVHAGWWVGKAISREPAHAEVAPGIWVGRRAGAAELPPQTRLVVDLTSELLDPPVVRRHAAEYLCLPTLDAAVPDEQACRAALERIAASPGPIYIHCAQGHGRSGTFAAAVLILRGLARDVDDAVSQLAAKRPGVRLNRRQRAFVTNLTQPQPHPPAGPS